MSSGSGMMKGQLKGGGEKKGEGEEGKRWTSNQFLANVGPSLKQTCL
ncbi:hypothetical protein HYH85_18830, partial [Clostridium botulinum]|nr:hypothetical protein [Clostridium botulinum]